MGKRLGQLREGAEASDATEADVLLKTAILLSRQKAIEKTPDKPGQEVIERKLARREDFARSIPRRFPSTYLDIDSGEVFDRPYNPALHKRQLIMQLRSLTQPSRIRACELEPAMQWRQAMVRDAPLLKGFLDQRPQWRRRLLKWGEGVLKK